jgi:hypothetical protein
MINPLNAELNSICHLLALLGANHIFHVSMIRDKDHFSALNTHRKYDIAGAQHYLEQVTPDNYPTRSESRVF